MPTCPLCSPNKKKRSRTLNWPLRPRGKYPGICSGGGQIYPWKWGKKLCTVKLSSELASPFSSGIQQTVIRDVLILVAVLRAGIWEFNIFPALSESSDPERVQKMKQAITPSRSRVVIGKVCMYQNRVILATFLPFLCLQYTDLQIRLPQGSWKVETSGRYL